MPVPTIEWQDKKVKIIDQTKLPHKLEHLICDRIEVLWEAIKSLRVRGAPALGIAGAMGVFLGIKDSRAQTFEKFLKDLEKTIDYLGTSRPTAVNLFWGLKRMRKTALLHRDKPVPRIKSILFQETLKIIEEDKETCRKIGFYGAKLLRDGDTVLTHCNAGGLATADYGTALGVLFWAREQGKRITVFADETRPLLQGARLTTWELMKAGIEVILICDNMAATVMKEGKINCILVGADRVAANGDTANKIGTYNLAILARAHRIPFYIACPFSTIDFHISRGSQIPIEERSPQEITSPFGQRIAPRGVKVYNPAFDVTPARLITAFITERGIIKPPYRENLKRARGPQ